MSILYKKTLEVADQLNDTGCCSVIAYSIITGQSYQHAYKIFAAHGRKHGRGTTWSTTKSAYENTGYIMRLLETPRQCNGSNFTLKTIADYLPLRYGTFLVHTRTHAAAVVNGKLQDWAGDTKKVVKWVWEIVPVEQYNRPTILEIPEWLMEL